jgi:hypothetical protein
LVGETEVLGENLPQCPFVHHKLHMLCPDANPGRRGGKPATARLAQAVSRWRPTAVARVRAQVRSCGVCGGQSGTGAGFLGVLRVPVPVPNPPTAPHSSSSSIIRGWYNRPVSGQRTKWTQSQETGAYYFHASAALLPVSIRYEAWWETEPNGDSNEDSAYNFHRNLYELNNFVRVLNLVYHIDFGELRYSSMHS